VVDSEHPNLGFFVPWIRAFAERCDRLVIIANQVGTYSLPDNVTVLSLGKEKGEWRTSRYLRFLRFVMSHTAEYDAVFCHMNPEFVLAGAWWWRLVGKKVALWYVHGKVSLRLRFALLFSNTALTVNEESLRIKSKKVHYLGHGIDTDFFAPAYRLLHDELLVVSVSRIARAKHLEDILEAVRLAREGGAKIRLSVLGGPLTQQDKSYAAELHGANAHNLFVKFLGAQPPSFVREALSSADIFINASSTNSVDKAVLEAMASGVVPVTNNPAFKNILKPYGLYIEDRSPRALADKLVALTKTDLKPLRETMRREVVSHHALPTLITSILQTYEPRA
jgi:glycosyltransferase involved in cell wall biosynthesis